jgi:hypothetical protein
MNSILISRDDYTMALEKKNSYGDAKNWSGDLKYIGPDLNAQAPRFRTPAPATQTPVKPATTTGQVKDATTGIWYTPIKSDDEYWNLITLSKTPEQLAATKNYAPKAGSFAEWDASKKSTKQAPSPAPSPAPAKTQATAPAPAAPKAPATPAKPKYDTTGMAEYNRLFGQKKLGGSLSKYDGGGGVNLEKSNDTFTTYNDGSIFNKKTNSWMRGADPNWKPEGVPSMKYEGDKEQPTEKTTGTTTTTTFGDITDPKEKAIKALAEAYGVDPNQTWEAFQNMTTYGTMGAGTQQPYGYGVSSMVPYRYRHRGYGTIGLDRGYVPGVGDLAAMQEQANRMGYEFTGKSRPTLFGGRKVVIKTRYNPNTGVVETKPVVAPDNIQEPQEPVISSSGLIKREAEAGYAYGGSLQKFLPKHQVMGETGLKFDNLDINIPIMDTIHNIGEKYQHGLTSIKDFNQERKQKRDERRGTDEKAVWKTGPSPYAAENVLTTMAFASNLGRGKERRELEEDLANKMSSDYMFTAKNKDSGNYVVPGSLSGEFMSNQKTPTFDTGYQRGNAGRSTYGKIGGQFDRGGSVAYSDWSQTPVNGYYGIPTGEMTMYPHWTQAPVMQSGGVTINSEEEYKKSLLMKNKTKERMDAERAWAGKKIAAANQAKTTPYKTTAASTTSTNAPQQAALKQEYNQIQKEKEKQRLAEIDARKANLSPESYSTYNFITNEDRGPVLQNGVDTRSGRLMVQDTIPVKGTMSDYGGTRRETIYYPNFEAFGRVPYSMPQMGLKGVIPTSSYINMYSPYAYRKEGGAMMQDNEMYLTDEEIAEIIQMGGQVEYLD